MKVTKSFTQGFKLILSDKINFLMALIPILLGATLFYFLGDYILDDLHAILKEYIVNKLGDSGWSSFLEKLVFGLLSIIVFLIVNWFFVIIVTILASPFNFILSNRIRKTLNGEEVPGMGEEIKSFWSNFFRTILDEIKKSLLIIFLVVLSLILSFVPVLNFAVWAINALLFSYDYLDFSFSHYEYSYQQLVKNYRMNFFIYLLSGVGFLLIISVPVVNIFIPALACAHFTVLYSHGKIDPSTHPRQVN